MAQIIDSQYQKLIKTKAWQHPNNHNNNNSHKTSCVDHHRVMRNLNCHKKNKFIHLKKENLYF